MDIPEYKLSTILCGHSLDVRGLAITRDYCLLSASRDKTAKLWHPEGVKDYINIVTYKGHKNFISTVCWLPPCETYPEGLVVTGSNDNTILGYTLMDGVVQFTLEGHENAVCFVAPGRAPGMLLSASWDNTAKIWNVNTRNVSPLSLKGHQAAVWAVIELVNGTYATASADKTLKLWNKEGSCLKTLTGHTDCVRGLVVASNETFLSCSNDASIKLWKNNGECLNTYYGHSNYIYGITMNPSLNSNCFVTCGEDASVRLWLDGDCIACINLPAQSVWSVVCMENGDIVAGSSDSLIRVFTKDPSRFADETTLATHNAEVEKMIAASQQEIGGYKLTDIPGPEVLLEPGKTEGQTKLVRTGTNVKCYSWNSAKQIWDEIGDVMGSKPASVGKTMFNGEEYDFVFSVDIKDGAPAIKLPFNITEDPWVAAQAFIHKNDLPQVYLEQVANFIITNAKLDKLPPMPNNGAPDPFTGESRYVPSSESNSFKSDSAKDPFTGAGAYTTAASANELKLIPHNSYIRFDQANLLTIKDKLKEFNSKVGDGMSPLREEQLDDIVKLGEVINSYSSETVDLLKNVLKWPKEILFPVLDITRLAIRNSDVNKIMFDSTYGPEFVKYMLSLLTPDNLVANQLLSLRVLVNAFSALAGEMTVIANHDAVAHALMCFNPPNVNAQIAATSLLLNLAVALAQQSDNADLVDCSVQFLNRTTDNEAYFRGLMALGTLLAESPNKIQIQSKIISNTPLHNRLQKDAASSPSDANLMKISTCSKQILRLL